MPFKNFQLNQIQNGRLSATIYFHIADIWLTVLDSWTITIKQNVRFQERMHLEKKLTRSNLSIKWPPIGHYSLSHGRYLVNRARWLDHYYRTKCEISAEDACWKILTNQIKNGRLKAIIHLNMAVIW